MRKYIYLFALFVISVVFFYKSFFLLQIPFPGGLLISEYAPWKYESYLGYNPGSYPNKAQYFDVIRQLYPWKMLVVDEIKQGRLPLWNPYNFSGSPLLANHQSAVFNPFNLFFFIFSPSIAWSAFIIVQPFLAALFTYIYLRLIKLSAEASLMGSVAFGFSLFMSTFLEYGNFGHVIMWLPFALYLVEKANAGKKYAFLFPFVVSFIIFAGHLQLAFGTLLLLFFYILFRPQRIKLLVLLFLGIGISAVQLVPTLELIGHSARSPHELSTVVKNFLLQFNQIVLFISPDAYGNPASRNYLLTDTYPGNAVFIGVAPLLFSLIAFTKIKRNFHTLFFGVAGLVLLVFLTNNPISYIFYSLKLPLISTSAPSNFIFLLSFSLSVLAAAGVDIWKKEKSKPYLYVCGIVVCAFSLIIFIHEIFGISYLLKQALLGGLILLIVCIGIVVGRKFGWKIAFYCLFLLTCAELFYYFHKFNPFVPASLLYPSTEISKYLQNNAGYKRFWGVGGAAIEANFATQMRVFSPEGYDPLYPRWYAQSVSGSGGFEARSDARLPQSGSGEPLGKNGARQQVLDSQGVAYILDRVENGSSETTFPQEKFNTIYQRSGWKIMESKTALPRVFTISSDCQAADIYKCFASGLINEGQIVSYNPSEVVIKNGTQSGLLVLSDTYYPGWQARVGEEERPIVKLSNGMRGIEDIKSGQTVTFAFHPLSFQWGVIITIISSIAVLLFVRKSLHEK